jgi:hydrogenase/urease accessory protein HupE
VPSHSSLRLELKTAKHSTVVSNTKRFFGICLISVRGLFFALSAQAHDVGLSTATVHLYTNRLEAVLTFAARETEEIVSLDLDQNGTTSPDEFALGREKLTEALATNCQVRFDDTTAKLLNVRCQLDSSNNVDLFFSCELPSFKRLDMSFEVIRLLTPGHRMFFTLLTPSEETVAERLLSQNTVSVSIDMDASALEPAPTPKAETAPPTFVGFLKLGIEHILTGYDHLLFLFALLVVTRDFKSAIKVITCFTIAHSITLGVATFDLVQISSRIVEPLIAASIVYVGIENIWKRGDPHGRWMLTFAFGLVHGFGFASVLRELGVGSRGGVAMPLFSFNLGVEMGQIAVAAIVLPIVWQLRKSEMFLKRGVPVCSLLVAVLGAIWFVQRVWPR